MDIVALIGSIVFYCCFFAKPLEIKSHISKIIVLSEFYCRRNLRVFQIRYNAFLLGRNHTEVLIFVVYLFIFEHKLYVHICTWYSQQNKFYSQKKSNRNMLIIDIIINMCSNS